MRTELLTMLRETNEYVSGQKVCETFGVSRTAVWKAINQLRKNGYEIEAVSNKGYRLISIPDILNQNELLSRRKTKWVGVDTLCYDTIDSTNAQAKRLAEEGYGNGTLIVADHQEAGRGRRGRSWESPAGTTISMTLLLKPDINPNNASMITLVSALAVAKAITQLTGVPAGIKWPNDIVMNGKKVCGILTEMSAQFDYVNHIVVGIGINVNTESFPEEIKDMATSLRLETGKFISRAELIEAVWEQFEEVYEIYLQTQDLQNLIKDYNARLVNMHQRVKVLDPKEPFEGNARGITPRGELMVDTWESRKLVSSGEVSVRGIYGYV